MTLLEQLQKELAELGAQQLRRTLAPFTGMDDRSKGEFRQRRDKLEKSILGILSRMPLDPIVHMTWEGSREQRAYKAQTIAIWRLSFQEAVDAELQNLGLVQKAECFTENTFINDPQVQMEHFSVGKQDCHRYRVYWRHDLDAGSSWIQFEIHPGTADFVLLTGLLRPCGDLQLYGHQEIQIQDLAKLLPQIHKRSYEWAASRPET